VPYHSTDRKNLPRNVGEISFEYTAEDYHRWSEKLITQNKSLRANAYKKFSYSVVINIFSGSMLITML